jgi:flavin-dependent dehydrogenase
MNANTFDVVICGGGLAGLTLAIQLKNAREDIAICIVERQVAPLPEAAHKVGESTVVIGAYYLEKVLGLKHFLEETQLEKLGLRFFFTEPGKPQAAFHDRPELGRSRHKAAASEWQLDRGRLENDLRRMVAERGVVFIEDASVKDVALRDETGHNTVHYEQAGQVNAVRGKWVVDSMGRRRLLQRKLGLARDSVFNSHSSSWFRIQGRLNFADYVPPAEKAWHGRVQGGHPTSPDYGRNNSTTHFVGDGYWVWVIPLSSGNTSIGLVAEESKHPFASYNSLEALKGWLKQHEFDLHEMVREHTVLDFGFRRNYSYSCTEFVSADGWALTGEAGVFIDPMYSPGTDSIGYANSVITDMVCRDLAGQRCADEVVRFINKDFVAWSDRTLVNIYDTYALLGTPEAACLKVVWDLASSVWLNGVKFRNAIFSDHTVEQLTAYGRAMASCMDELQRLEKLKARTIALLNAWQEQGPRHTRLRWLDYFDDLGFLFSDLSRVVAGSHDMQEELRFGLRRLEDLALALCIVVFKDVDAARAAVLEERIAGQGIRLCEIDLDPGMGDSAVMPDAPHFEARDLSYIMEPLTRAFFDPAP